MKLALETRSPMDALADVLVLGRYADPTRPAAEMVALDKKLDGLLSTVLGTEKFEGKAGQVAHFYTGGRIPAARVMVVGLGPKKSGDAEILRRATATSARRARDLGATSVAVFMPADGLPARARAQAIVEGGILGTYRFDKYLKEKSRKVLESLAVIEPDRRQHLAAREGVRVGEAWAAATCLARDLVNEPANMVTPSSLAACAEEIAQGGRHEPRGARAGGLREARPWARISASPRGARSRRSSSISTYVPKGRPRRRVAVIGKGITFDSGGLDLKPADGMLRMKDDMSGAAAVLGIFQALPHLKPPVEVHGLIAATENMPSGTAQRPGDIVRAMNGLTIEIGNTDAEGRLTLADALAYAAKEIKPDEMLDMATLTGAIVVALGLGVSGLFASHDGLASRLLSAASAAGEKMWRMPLHEEYKEGIKSDIADLNNISSQRGGGAIVAGLFMRDFTAGIPWAHLDIAGTAFAEREHPLGPKGATGVAVRTVLSYLTALGGK